MHTGGEGPPNSSALQALNSGALLSDSFFYNFLDLLDEEWRSSASALRGQWERRRALPA